MKRKKATKQKHQQTKVRKQAMALLEDSRFLHLALRKTGEQGVVGELRNRLVIFLAALTKGLAKPVSVLIKGPRSTGKNNIIKAVINLLPPECLLPRSSLSRKALAYGKDPLAGKVVYLYQLDGGRESQLLMRMLMSEGGLAHEHTQVTEGKRTTQLNQREGTPVILSTTTAETIYEDDETRFLSVRSDESAELTKEVVHAELSKDANATK
jgi:hypothetical protein